MPYITYNNVKAFLSTGDEQGLLTSNYNVMYATNITASNTTSFKRIKRVGQELDYYNQTGPKNTSISARVIPVTGAGINQFNDFVALTGDFVSGSCIQVPNYRFDKCFLKSLQFSIEPWKPISLDMQFDCYGLTTGNGLSSSTSAVGAVGLVSPLRGVSISLSTTGFTQAINEYESLNFNLEVERLANFEINAPYPSKVSASRITKTLQIDGISNADWLSDYEPNNFVAATLTMADGNSFSVSGVLASQTVSINNNNAVKIGIQIVEDLDMNVSPVDYYYFITSDGDEIITSLSEQLISS
jgi:hypothetical protein